MSERKKNNDGAQLSSTEKEKKVSRTRKEKIKLAVILVLVILLALVVVGFALYRSWAKAPEIPDVPNIPVNNKGDENETVESGKEKEDSPAELPEEIRIRKDDYYSFLLVGRDTGGGGNTDTILLVSYDVANQELNVMSIPRDTMVNIDYDIKRINAVYNYAGGGDEGIAALYAEVSQLIGFIPDYEVIVEWKAVGELVDAIGGVWFDVPRNMNYDDPVQDLHIHIDKGYQLLDGEAAMGVIRWRKNNDNTGYVSGDIGRIETQQAFLKAVAAQCLKIENVKKVQEFAKLFADNVQTDLSLGNLAWFAEQAIFGGLTVERVNFITMPGNYTGTAWSYTYNNYQSYVLPDAEELLTVVNEKFNPYLAQRTAEQLDIMSVNEDGSLSSTSGVVEDSKAAMAPVIPVRDPDEEENGEEAEQETTEEATDTEAPVVTGNPEASEETNESNAPDMGASTENPAESTEETNDGSDNE